MLVVVKSASSGYSSVEDVQTALSDRFKVSAVAFQPVNAGVYVTRWQDSNTR